MIKPEDIDLLDDACTDKIRKLEAWIDAELKRDHGKAIVDMYTDVEGIGEPDDRVYADIMRRYIEAGWSVTMGEGRHGPYFRVQHPKRVLPV